VILFDFELNIFFLTLQLTLRCQICFQPMRDENYDLFYINMNDDRFKMLQESIGFSGET